MAKGSRHEENGTPHRLHIRISAAFKQMLGLKAKEEDETPSALVKRITTDYCDGDLTYKKRK